MRRRVTVVGYVCVSGSIFPNSNELAKNVLAHRSAILLALAGARAYIHSRDVTLDQVWCFCYGLCHCVWHDAI